MMETQVVLVSEQDEVLGTAEKMAAHREGLLHRAFSVFIFDGQGRFLIQQRASGKYHGGGLWTNACCSHPFPGEGVVEAASRRLQEELGFNTRLQKIFHFTYRAEVENGLIEHEFDHVFAGIYEGPLHPDPSEVSACRYETWASIEKEMQASPESFTIWFRLIAPQLAAWWQQEGSRTLV